MEIQLSQPLQSRPALQAETRRHPQWWDRLGGHLLPFWQKAPDDSDRHIPPKSNLATFEIGPECLISQSFDCKPGLSYHFTILWFSMRWGFGKAYRSKPPQSGSDVFSTAYWSKPPQKGSNLWGTIQNIIQRTTARAWAHILLVHLRRLLDNHCWSTGRAERSWRSLRAPCGSQLSEVEAWTKWDIRIHVKNQISWLGSDWDSREGVGPEATSIHWLLRHCHLLLTVRNLLGLGKQHYSVWMVSESVPRIFAHIRKVIPFWFFASSDPNPPR